MSEATVKRPSLGMALLPIIISLVIFIGGIGILKYPAELMLLFAGVVFTIFAVLNGHKWDTIITVMGEKIKKALPAILILFSIGLLIGTWMISGTIPLFVYYGLAIIDPSYLYLLAFLVTAIVSTCVGTSWGSAGTIGVAIMSIAQTMDLSLAITAGAVVSGAYFGDKLSPLSDTTNMSSLAAGSNLYEHIKHMLYTTIPSSLIAIIVFTIVGFGIEKDSAQLASIQEMMTGLDQLFNLNIFLLIPAIVVIAGSLMKKPPLIVLFTSAITALVLAWITQGATVSNLFASALEVSQALNVILERIIVHLKTIGSITFSALVTGFAVINCTSNALVSFFLVQDIYGKVYKEKKLHPVNLSRNMEDSITITEVLMPWTVSGVFMATTLGVGNFEFLPWAIFNLGGFIFSALYGFLAPYTKGFGIRKLEEDDDFNTAAVADSKNLQQ